VPRRPIPVPTPRPASDPTGEAIDMSGRYPKPPAPPSGRYVPAPGAKPKREPAPRAAEPAKKFDWTTPALMALVAVLSGVIGYLLLTR
jgi:hypothetical protein